MLFLAKLIFSLNPTLYKGDTIVLSQNSSVDTFSVDIKNIVGNSYFLLNNGNINKPQFTNLIDVQLPCDDASVCVTNLLNATNSALVNVTLHNFKWTAVTQISFKLSNVTFINALFTTQFSSSELKSVYFENSVISSLLAPALSNTKFNNSRINSNIAQSLKNVTFSNVIISQTQTSNIDNVSISVLQVTDSLQILFGGSLVNNLQIQFVEVQSTKFSVFIGSVTLVKGFVLKNVVFIATQTGNLIIESGTNVVFENISISNIADLKTPLFGQLTGCPITRLQLNNLWSTVSLINILQNSSLSFVSVTNVHVKHSLLQNPTGVNSAAFLVNNLSTTNVQQLYIQNSSYVVQLSYKSTAAASQNYHLGVFGFSVGAASIADCEIKLVYQVLTFNTQEVQGLKIGALMGNGVNMIVSRVVVVLADTSSISNVYTNLPLSIFGRGTNNTFSNIQSVVNIDDSRQTGALVINQLEDATSSLINSQCISTTTRPDYCLNTAVINSQIAQFGYKVGEKATDPQASVISYTTQVLFAVVSNKIVVNIQVPTIKIVPSVIKNAPALPNQLFALSGDVALSVCENFFAFNGTTCVKGAQAVCASGSLFDVFTQQCAQLSCIFDFANCKETCLVNKGEICGVVDDVLICQGLIKQNNTAVCSVVKEGNCDYSTALCTPYEANSLGFILLALALLFFVLFLVCAILLCVRCCAEREKQKRLNNTKNMMNSQAIKNHAYDSKLQNSKNQYQLDSTLQLKQRPITGRTNDSALNNVGLNRRYNAKLKAFSEFSGKNLLHKQEADAAYMQASQYPKTRQPIRSASEMGAEDYKYSSHYKIGKRPGESQLVDSKGLARKQNEDSEEEYESEVGGKKIGDKRDGKRQKRDEKRHKSELGTSDLQSQESGNVQFFKRKNEKVLQKSQRSALESGEELDDESELNENQRRVAELKMKMKQNMPPNLPKKGGQQANQKDEDDADSLTSSQHRPVQVDQKKMDLLAEEMHLRNETVEYAYQGEDLTGDTNLASFFARNKGKKIDDQD